MTDPQTPGGWDGRPQNPERDGWHWLQWVGLFPADTLGHTNPVARYWEKDGWWDGSMHRHARYWREGWRYLGPCLTPAEVAARVEAARREGIEAAAEVARCVPIPEDCCHNEAHGRLSAALEAAMRIRALLEDGR